MEVHLPVSCSQEGHAAVSGQARPFVGLVAQLGDQTLVQTPNISKSADSKKQQLSKISEPSHCDPFVFASFSLVYGAYAFALGPSQAVEVKIRPQIRVKARHGHMTRRGPCVWFFFGM